MMINFKNAKKLLKSNGLSEELATVSIKNDLFEKPIKIRLSFPSDFREKLNDAPDKATLVNNFRSQKISDFSEIIANISETFSPNDVLSLEGSSEATTKEIRDEYAKMLLRFKCSVSDENLPLNFGKTLSNYVNEIIYETLDKKFPGTRMSNDEFSGLIKSIDSVSFAVNCNEDAMDALQDKHVLWSFIQSEFPENAERKNGNDVMPLEIHLNADGKSVLFVVGALLLKTDKYGDITPASSFLDFVDFRYTETVMDDVRIRHKMVEAVTEAFKIYVNQPDYNGNVLSDYDTSNPYDKMPEVTNDELDQEAFLEGERYFNPYRFEKEDYFNYEFLYNVHENKSSEWTGEFKPTFCEMAENINSMIDDGDLKRGGLVSVCHLKAADSIIAKLIISDNILTGEETAVALIPSTAFGFGFDMIRSFERTVLMAYRVMKHSGNFITGSIRMKDMDDFVARVAAQIAA